MAAAVLGALVLAVPAMAQVDWSGISGKTGQSACPDGATQSRAGLIGIQAQPGATSVTARNTALGFADLQTWTGKPLSTSFSVGLWLYGPDNVLIRGQGLGTATSFRNIAQQTRTWSDPKPGARYVARVRTPGTPLARRCFQMPPDLNKGLGWHDDIQMFASGCFAAGLTRAQASACLCGARHADGRWARTDADAGFEWQISAAERTRLGCTTN